MTTFKNVLFWIVSFTWGILMTLFGCIVALGCLCAGKKPQKFHHYVRFEFGGNWGGLEAGPFFFSGPRPSLHLKQHESGHGYQNIVLGPFMPFVVSIPSATRYWIQEYRSQKARYLFISILCTIILILAVGFFCLGFFLSKVWWFMIISGLLAGYDLILFCWAAFKEIPQYKNNAYVNYDWAWYEGAATHVGECLFPKENQRGSLRLRDIFINPYKRRDG